MNTHFHILHGLLETIGSLLATRKQHLPVNIKLRGTLRYAHDDYLAVE